MFKQIIDGRAWRIIEVEASDTREAAHHISAERPLSFAEQRAMRARLGEER